MQQIAAHNTGLEAAVQFNADDLRNLHPEQSLSQRPEHFLQAADAERPDCADTADVRVKMRHQHAGLDPLLLNRQDVPDPLSFREVKALLLGPAAAFGDKALLCLIADGQHMIQCHIDVFRVCDCSAQFLPDHGFIPVAQGWPCVQDPPRHPEGIGLARMYGVNACGPGKNIVCVGHTSPR